MLAPVICILSDKNRWQIRSYEFYQVRIEKMLLRSCVFSQVRIDSSSGHVHSLRLE